MDCEGDRKGSVKRVVSFDFRVRFYNVHLIGSSLIHISTFIIRSLD